jgi:hypothetical protein
VHQAIALYTFIGVWMGITIQSKRVTGGIIGIIWFFIGLLILLGNVLNNGARVGFERPAPVSPFYSTIFLSLLMNLLCSTGAGLGILSSCGGSWVNTCGSGLHSLSLSSPTSPSISGAAETSPLMMFRGGSSPYSVRLTLPKTSKASGAVR